MNILKISDYKEKINEYVKKYWWVVVIAGLLYYFLIHVKTKKDVSKNAEK